MTVGHYLTEAVKQMVDFPEDWLNDLRRKGQLHIERTGLPTAKIEEWKYTPLKFLNGTNFAPDVHHGHTISEKQLPADLFEKSSVRAVVCNGLFRRDLMRGRETMPKGVSLTSLSRMINEYPGFAANYLGKTGVTETQIMLALNSQYMTDGYVLHIAKDTVIDKPIEILFYGEGEKVRKPSEAPMFHPRHLIVMEEGAQATIIEHHTGKDSYVTNHGYEIFLGKGATCHHYRYQNESASAAHIATTNLIMQRNVSYDGFTLTTGASLSRNDVTANIDGEHSNCRVNGAYLLDKKQHCDTTILVHHTKENGKSNQMFKGILDDYARGIFQGKIFVHKGAQKTDGYQLNNAMMLSDTAEMDVKPELEIYADDVRCSHGATTGRIDEGPLFYLMSRGIDKTTARKMLMQAFLAEAFEEIWHEQTKEIFASEAEKWLDAHSKQD